MEPAISETNVSTQKDDNQNDNKQKDKVVVTAALPYANGDLHIGHLLEYIQTDIYVRYLKLAGKDALYICASDMHGTPVEVNARKQGIDPEKFALKYWKAHHKDLVSYHIEFDNFYKTHSPENKELAEWVFSKLQEKDLIYRKKMDIIYCDSCARSLPDRFVKGTCPHCTTNGQYGDICESCGTILKGVDLINPKCTLCGKTPIQKESEHYFFKLSKFSTRLNEWMDSSVANLQPEVKNWLKNWLDGGLEDWCVSRDAPYFGFEIPNSVEETGERKFFYVWLDAPIGYISSTKHFCDTVALAEGRTACKWQDYWYDGKVEHIIGKDISYFHFLFWPAILMAVDIPIPELNVHGFITVDGKKMSKSRGTFFTARDFLDLFSAESLRFFYASHLDRRVVDIDMSFTEFQSVVNNVLVGNLGNYCYRVLTFAQKNHGKVEMIASGDSEKELIGLFDKLVIGVKSAYAGKDFKTAVKLILQIADLGNAYFQKSEVWKDKSSDEAKVGFCVNLARNLVILVSPILPEFSKKVYGALGLDIVSSGSGVVGESNVAKPSNVTNELSLFNFDDIGFDFVGDLKKPALLVQKIEHIPKTERFPLQMAVGEIVSVKDHPNADSLLLMQVNLGAEFGERQVVAGLKKYFSDLSTMLVGKKAVFCVNMKPAKLRGEKSSAMIFAADDGEHVGLLEVEKSEVGNLVVFAGLENSVSEVTFDEFLKVKMVVGADGVVLFDSRKMSTAIEDVKVSGGVAVGAPVK